MTVVYDATGCVLGRLASTLASDVLDGEEVRVLNAERAVVTGERTDVLDRYRQKYQTGSQRKGPHFPRTPDRIVKRTVRGMLPHDQAKGREAYKRLKCYIGEPEEFDDADPEPLEGLEPGERTERVEVAEISEHLGAKVR